MSSNRYFSLKDTRFLCFNTALFVLNIFMAGLVPVLTYIAINKTEITTTGYFVFPILGIMAQGIILFSVLNIILGVISLRKNEIFKPATILIIFVATILIIVLVVVPSVNFFLVLTGNGPQHENTIEQLRPLNQ